MWHDRPKLTVSEHDILMYATEFNAFLIALLVFLSLGFQIWKRLMNASALVSELQFTKIVLNTALLLSKN